MTKYPEMSTTPSALAVEGARLYTEKLSLTGATWSLIKHEEAIVAWVFMVELPGGEQRVLKVCPRNGDSRREAYCLQRLGGKVPVPQLLKQVDAESGLPGAVLMEYLPGVPLSTVTCDMTFAHQAGALLAHIHEERTAGFGDMINPMELSCDPVATVLAKFVENLQECQGHLSDALLQACRRIVDRDVHLLDSVDGPCIAHRDFRPRNLLVSDAGIQGIIDWSSSRSWFAEEDFTPLEHGDWTDSQEVKEAFLRGYASVRAVPEYRRLMPLLGLTQALGAVGFTIKHGTWQTKHLQLYTSNLSRVKRLVAGLPAHPGGACR